MEDKDILALYRARSEEALAATAEKYGALCRSVAKNILPSGEDAEECVNDAWLGAWNSIPPQQPENLSAYLARLTRNAALDRFRRERAGKRGAGEVPAALEELGECVPARGGVEEALDAQALAAAVDRFLRMQPELQRKLFLQRYWYLAPVGEIARMWGMSRSRAASVLHRTRNALKQYLKQEGFI